jgi:DNA-binding NarL/FixJ family response regulator
MAPTRIILADDHQLVRAGIRSLLRRMHDVQVVAEASDGDEALRLIATEQPDIVLMDIGMAAPNGLAATERIAQEFPDVRVIILSMHDNKEYVLQALRAGAAGYLLKDSAKAELELAVRAVARGETYLSPPVSKHVIAAYVQRALGAAAAPESEADLQRLTPRQREVLRLIAAGHTSQAIANTLGISVKTVETHRAQIMERLDIHDVAGLVRYALRMGLANNEPQC